MKILHQSLAIILLLSGGLLLQAKPKKKDGTKDPGANFEELWQTFHKRYAFFELQEVDWKKQYATFRPKVTKETSDEELFRILCEMLAPLKDGHVNLKARGAFKGKFNPEDKPFFHRGFAKQRLIDDIFRLTEKNLVEKGFSEAKTPPNYLVMPDRTNWATCA
jgi:hypothetical protein